MSSKERAAAAAPEGAAVIAIEGFAPGGYTLYWIDASRPQDNDIGYGLAVSSTGEVLGGRDGFRAASPGLSAADQARLAALLLGEGGEPLAGAETEAQHQAGVSAPAELDGALIWWSEERRLSAPGLRRHTLRLSTLSLEIARPEDRVAQDPAALVAEARALLASTSSFDQDGAVRSLAALCPDSLATAALIEALSAHERPETRVGAARAMAGCPEGSAALIAALSDPESSVRAAAATTLGELGDPGARAALEALRDSDPHADPRGAARRALAKLP